MLHAMPPPTQQFNFRKLLKIFILNGIFRIVGSYGREGDADEF